jgi:hypothetical protein
VYNKATQLHGKEAEHNTIRVEARVRIRCKAMGLATMADPFRNSQLFSLHCHQPPYGTAHWRAFVDSCRLRGIRNAILMQPADYRAKLAKYVSEKPVSWWKMGQEDWEHQRINALEDAGLTQIPDHAPPLTMQNAVGGE